MEVKARCWLGLPIFARVVTGQWFLVISFLDPPIGPPNGAEARQVHTRARGGVIIDRQTCSLTLLVISAMPPARCARTRASLSRHWLRSPSLSVPTPLYSRWPTR